MSVPSDDIGFWARLNNGLNSGSLMNDPLMGLAAGLLQAAGPSRMPTSLGQALGAGLQTGQQFQGAGIQNALQRIQLQQAIQGQQYFNSLLNPGGPTQQPTPQQTVDQTQAPAALGAALSNQPATPQPQSGNGLQPISPIAQPALQQAPIPKLAPMQPRLPTVQDPSADPTYQHYIQQARLAEYFKQGSGKPFEDLANSRLAELNNQVVTLDPDQAKLIIPGGLPAGQSLQFHPYSGKADTIGSDAIAQMSTFSPATGTFMPTLVDKRTGKPIGGSGSNAAFDPAQPLPGNLESQAQAVASYTQPPPTMSSRNPSAGLILARARFINPDYDATQYGAKSKAASYFTTGEGGKQLTAFNTAVSHLATLEPLIDNMGNTQSPMFNRAKNFFAQQTGSTAPTDLATAKQYVGGELAKVVAGGNMTESDRNQAQSALNSANTPEQLKSAIQVIKTLMGGKLTALETQYKAAGLNNFEKRLEPASLDALNKFSESQVQTGNNGLPQGWSVQVH